MEIGESTNPGQEALIEFIYLFQYELPRTLKSVGRLVSRNPDNLSYIDGIEQRLARFKSGLNSLNEDNVVSALKGINFEDFIEFTQTINRRSTLMGLALSKQANLVSNYCKVFLYTIHKICNENGINYDYLEGEAHKLTSAPTGFAVELESGDFVESDYGKSSEEEIAKLAKKIEKLVGNQEAALLAIRQAKDRTNFNLAYAITIQLIKSKAQEDEGDIWRSFCSSTDECMGMIALLLRNSSTDPKIIEYNISQAYSIIEKSLEFGSDIDQNAAERIWSYFMSHAIDRVSAAEYSKENGRKMANKRIVAIIEDAAYQVDLSKIEKTNVSNVDEAIAAAKKRKVALADTQNELRKQINPDMFGNLSPDQFNTACIQLSQLFPNPQDARSIITKLFAERMFLQAAKLYKNVNLTAVADMQNVQGAKHWSRQLGSEDQQWQSKIPDKYKIILGKDTNMKKDQIAIYLDGDQVKCDFRDVNKKIISIHLDNASPRVRSALTYGAALSYKRKEEVEKFKKMISEAIIYPQKKGTKDLEALQKKLEDYCEVILSNDPEIKPTGNQLKISYDRASDSYNLSYSYSNTIGASSKVAKATITITETDELYTKYPDFFSRFKAALLEGSEISLAVTKLPPITPMVLDGECIGEISDVVSRYPSFVEPLPIDDEAKTYRIKTILTSIGIQEGYLTDENLFKPQNTVEEVKQDIPIPTSYPSPHRMTGTLRVLDTSVPNVYSLPTGERRAAASGHSGARTVVEAPAARNPTIALSNPLARKASSRDPFDGLEASLTDINKINGIDKDGNSFLHLLCKNTQADATSIIGSINYLCEWMQNRGYTHQATDAGGIVRESISNEAIIEFLNQKNVNGETALHLLCKNIHHINTDLAQLIIELYMQGADLNVPDKDNISPLQMLCGRGGSLEAVEYLCGEAFLDEKSNVISCVEERDKAIIDYQDISAGKYGFTPIYTAALGSLSRGIDSLSPVYEYLKDKGAKLDLAQTCNPDIPGTVAEYIQGKMRSYGVSSEASLSDTIHNKFKEVQSYIDNTNLVDLSNAMLLNKDLLKLTDKDGNGFLDYAVSKGNEDIINLLLESHPKLLEFRAELKNPESSLSAGILAGGLGVVGTCTYFAANMPKNPGEAIAASVASVGIAAASGAVIWGIGRLCYEGYHQYSSYGDANISQNFTRSMQNLQELETSVLAEDSLKCLNKLEVLIIEETKKTFPNIAKMAEDLIKCHLLRESLFKKAENKEAIIDASKVLIENFESWRKIQEGRETSKGLELFCDAFKSSIIGVIAGSAAALLTQNITASGVVGAGAAAVFTGRMWQDRVHKPSAENKGKQ